VERKRTTGRLEPGGRAKNHAAFTRPLSQSHHLGRFVVVPYLQNIAVRVAEVYGVLSVAPGPERYLSP